MTAPYFVEQTKRYGETGLLKRRFNYDTLEAARDRYDKCIEEENTSRVALCKRVVRNKHSLLKVWRASMA